MRTASKLIEATRVLLEHRNYKAAYKLYLDLIYNKIVEIGANLSVEPPQLDSKIYDYMESVDKFVHVNTGIELFGEHIEKAKSFFKRYDRVNEGGKNLVFSAKSVEDLAKEYFYLKNLSVPNVFEEFSLSKNQINNWANPMNARVFAFGKNSSKLKTEEIRDHLCDMELAKLEVEQNALVKKFQSGKESFDKSFKKLALLNSIKKSFEKSKKKSAKIEVKGKLVDTLEYSIYSEAMYGYLILGLSIVFGTLFGSLAFQSLVHPFLGASLVPYAAMSGVAFIILFIIFFKQFSRQ